MLGAREVAVRKVRHAFAGMITRPLRCSSVEKSSRSALLQRERPPN